VFAFSINFISCGKQGVVGKVESVGDVKVLILVYIVKYHYTVAASPLHLSLVKLTLDGAGLSISHNLFSVFISRHHSSLARMADTVSCCAISFKHHH